MSINSVKLNNDLATLAKYSAVATIVKTVDNPFEGFGLMAGLSLAMPTISGGKWLIDNRHDYKSAWKNLAAENVAKNTTNKALKGSNIFETMQNRSRYSTLNEYAGKYADATDATKRATLTEAKDIAKYNKKVAKSDYYKDVRKLIEDAKKLKGPEQKKALKVIEQKIAEANLNVHNAKISGNLQAITKRGKAWTNVKKYSGMNFVNGKTKAWAANSKIFRTVAKGAKGNAAFAVMSLAFEAPEIIDTYKELETAKGNKQLGRAVATTAAEVAGFAVGMKAGAIAGASIGAAIGTVVPVVGNVVGGIVGGLIGLGCGFLGGWAAKKGMQQLVGDKSELQKNADANEEIIRKELRNGNISEKELLADVRTKLENDSPDSEDAQKALKAYNDIVKELEEKAVEEDAEKEETSKTQNSYRESNSKTDYTKSKLFAQLNSLY